MNLQAGLMAGLMSLLALLGGCKKSEPAPEAVAASAPLPTMPPAPKGPERHIIALGDSLLAGYGLRPEEAYPPRLQAALRLRGIAAQIINAGVSGDTTEDGLARLDFTLASQPTKPDLVVLSLGGNDMLRGTPTDKTRANLDAIPGRLAQKHIKVVMMGMLSAPNMGPDYASRFNAIFPALAKQHDAVLVPFFLRPIYQRPDLQLPDHIHPTAQGVEAMVNATVETVAGALKVKERVPSLSKPAL